MPLASAVHPLQHTGETFPPVEHGSIVYCCFPTSAMNVEHPPRSIIATRTYVFPDSFTLPRPCVCSGFLFHRHPALHPSPACARSRPFCFATRQVKPSHLPTRETDRLFMWAGQMVQAPHLAVLQLGCVCVV